MNGTNVACEGIQLTAAQTEFFLREDDDAAALRGFVGEGGELRGIGEALGRDAGRGHEVAGLAVAEGDGAGLVEEQDVDIAGGFDGAAGGGEDVALEQAIHAGDADGAQQAADRRGNQAHEERDQRGDGEGDLGVGAERFERDDHEQENDREGGEQNRERNLVGCLLARRALDHCDHAIDEGVAGFGGDADDHTIAEHARATGHGATVAAVFTHDGGGFAGDDGLIDGGDALDDIAVGRDHVTGFADDEVAFDEIGGGDFFLAGAGETAGEGQRAGSLESIGLRLAATFGDGFGEVREQDGEEQPQGDLQDVSKRLGRGEELLKRQGGADEGDEHHRVFQLGARIEFADRVEGGLAENGAVEEGDGFGAHGRTPRDAAGRKLKEESLRNSEE